MMVMVDICSVNITATNLNLFVAFDALLTECHVTRAARRVGITQSAMSGALRNLRAVLGDPLFLRTSHGIVPTPRARELSVPVREGLRLFEQALRPQRFDPLSSGRTFTIATSDYVEFVLMGPLLKRLSHVAPQVRLSVLPWAHHKIPESLATGGVDLMIGFHDRLPSHHRDLLLFEETYAVIVRRDHPLVRRSLSVKTYASLRHIMVSQQPGARSGIDHALAARGLTREVSVRVAHFLNVPSLVASTDYAAALSRRVAEPFSQSLPIKLFAPPVRLRPSRVRMVWHDVAEAEPGHRWFRDFVAEVARTT